MNSKHKSVGLVGAKKEDLEHYDPTAKIIKPAEELKKHGGKLGMDEMAKIFG